MLMLRAGVDAGMDQRFGQRLVGFRQIDVLADQRDVDSRLSDARACTPACPSATRSAGGGLNSSLRQTISSSFCACSMPGIL